MPYDQFIAGALFVSKLRAAVLADREAVKRHFMRMGWEWSEEAMEQLINTLFYPSPDFWAGAYPQWNGGTCGAGGWLGVFASSWSLGCSDNVAAKEAFCLEKLAVTQASCCQTAFLAASLARAALKIYMPRVSCF
jgi:hypothetical protein